MLELYEKFSNRYKKYKNGTSKRVKTGGCKKKWEEFSSSEKVDNPLTMRTLEWMVKQDISIEKFNEMKKKSLKNAIYKSINTGDKMTGSHCDVAEVVCGYYNNLFVCSGIAANLWYYFNENKGGKWEITEMGHELRKRLSDEIVNVYEYYSSEYNEISKNTTGAEQTLNTVYYQNCLKIMIKLKDSNYKDKIIKECRELFYDKEFNNKINSNLNLLGFDNGVFDLINMEFRYGQPDDYVTISTNYSLPVTKNEMPISLDKLEERVLKTQHFKELNSDMNDFISQVLPNRKTSNNQWTDDRVRKYVMRFLSSCLSGEVCEEKFYFWTGSGGNGKSKIIELLDHSMGDYSKTLDVAFLTTKRGSASNASPEVETIKHARFISCSEPEEDDKIYVGKLKQITGGDKLTTRGLYKETTEFKPQFKIILMCNELPKLAGQDGGTWRRIEVVNFISRFRKDPHPTENDPHEFHADLKLSKKFDRWKVVFMIKLLKTYIEYKELGTEPPDEVTHGTKQYKEANDMIASWFNAEMEECELNDEDKAPTHINEAYEWFKDYCIDQGINKRDIPTKRKVRDTLIRYQETSEHGAVWGKYSPCGPKSSPSFTFKQK